MFLLPVHELRHVIAALIAQLGAVGLYRRRVSVASRQSALAGFNMSFGALC